jgi:hypothetical protein
MVDQGYSGCLSIAGMINAPTSLASAIADGLAKHDIIFYKE